MEKFWRAWKDAFVSISNGNAPIKISRVKDRYNTWINTEIIKTMYQGTILMTKKLILKVIYCGECIRNFEIKLHP